MKGLKIIIVALIMVTVLSGCSHNKTSTTNNPAENLLGTWNYSDEKTKTTLTFYSDSTWSWHVVGSQAGPIQHNGTYTISGSSITLSITSESLNLTARLIDSDTLILSNGNSQQQYTKAN